MNSWESQVREKENVAFSCVMLLQLLQSALLITVGKAWGLLWDPADAGQVPSSLCELLWFWFVVLFVVIFFPQGWCTNPTGPDGIRVHQSF